MAEVKTFAVVTGANRGIGLEVVRQLASHGITVILTARDEKRGLDALHKLKECSELSGDVIFHQLDVADSYSVASLAEFVKDQFGRLDILVNNAAVVGVVTNGDAFKTVVRSFGGEIDGSKINWDEMMIQTYELAVNCMQTNYYGVKRMIEAFIPLLQLSQSPRIVNVSTGGGKIQNLPSEQAKGKLNDANLLTEKVVDKVVNEFLKDFKEGSFETKRWPISAYIVSKVAQNAYTRIVAKQQPNMKVNCVCPGYVTTDMTHNTGIFTVEEGAERILKLALMPDDGPSGQFYVLGEVSSFY